jgi:hypothetical protein
LCEKSIAFEAAIEMAAAIRGGMDKLAEKPYFTQVVTPLPLYFAKTHSDQIILGAECGVPVTSGTISIGGGTGPITIAGSMTHCLATDFAAITLSQLVKKGSFCHGSSESSFMEPTTGSLGNAIPDLMADMAMRQVRGHYGLVPLAGGGGGSSAPSFNQDAVLDISTGLQEAFFLQGGTLDYLGIIDFPLMMSTWHSTSLAQWGLRGTISGRSILRVTAETTIGRLDISEPKPL